MRPLHLILSAGLLAGMAAYAQAATPDWSAFIATGRGACLESGSYSNSYRRLDASNGGSSAVYGSDAIGGVVNIVLNDNFDGLDTRLTYGGAEGTRDANGSVFWGRKFDGGTSQNNIITWSPDVAKSGDGRLWYVTREGVGIVDLGHPPHNALRPPVHIEEVIADRKSYETSANLRLPPLVRDLQFNYTALSLVAPEKVVFRYKLEGHERDWQDVGRRRQAFFSDLPPGKYRFRVIASNNSGVWNEQGAALDFFISAAYWQTTGFRALCVTAILLVLWALYQLRLRQIAQALNARLEERVAERKRIARDLHDTLLQSFQGLLLRFQTVDEMLPQRPADAKETLASAIDRTAQAVTEGREAVQGLRASTVESNDLSMALTSLGEELAAKADVDTSSGLRVQVEGTARTLRPIVRDDIFRIAGEALRNAFRHAGAKQIEVELRYDERQLRLRVRDDGTGIGLKFLTAEGRSGHFGLHGMRERAELVGGKLTVWSAPGFGTEIELSIPAARAYAESAAPRRAWFGKKPAEKSSQSAS